MYVCVHIIWSCGVWCYVRVSAYYMVVWCVVLCTCVCILYGRVWCGAMYRVCTHYKDFSNFANALLTAHCSVVHVMCVHSHSVLFFGVILHICMCARIIVVEDCVWCDCCVVLAPRSVMCRTQAEKELLSVDCQGLLIFWFNYQLSRAGSPRKVNNFSRDLEVRAFPPFCLTSPR